MNLILLVAALILSFLIFTFLVKVLRAAIGTALAIAVVVLVLQLLFGIGPAQVWEQLQELWHSLWRMIPGGSN